jgi:uncharacterized membrane protein
MAINQSRDETVDILRGLAILTMIAANAAGLLLRQPHPLALRLYGTFAAPLFIAISGAMVFKSAESKPDRTFSYFFKRGITVIFFGVFLDVVAWQAYPFQEMDVLYLIGLAIPLAYLVSRVNVVWRFALMIFFFAGALILQKVFGYRETISYVLLSDPDALSKILAGQVWRYWLCDGLFPIFPWVGFTFLGGVIASLRWPRNSMDRKKFCTRDVALSGLGIFLIGAVLWTIWPGPLLIRDNFSEMFYPPTWGYLITSCGLILFLLCITDKIRSKRPLHFLGVFGKSSMLMYILHWLVLLKILIRLPFCVNCSLGAFIIIYIVLSLFLIGIAFVMIRVRKHWRPSWLVARVLIGG